MAVVTWQVRSTRWVRAALAAAGLVAGLSGCVSTTTTTSGNPGPRSPNGKDMATASDQTSTDRLVKVRMDLASAYFARGQAKDALDEVKQALNVRPDSAEAYALRGLIYAQLGEPGTADESFHKALSLAPHDGDVTPRKGAAQFLADRLFVRVRIYAQ